MTSKSLIDDNERSLNHKSLTSYECYEISRLYSHLSKVTRDNGIHLTSDQYDTAKITLIRLEQRVGNIESLLIRPENEIELHKFSLQSFSSLEILTLNRIPPTTIVDLYSFRNKFKKIEIVNSGISELSKVFVPIKQKYLKFPPLSLLNNYKNSNHGINGNYNHKQNPDNRFIWSKLEILIICNCGLTFLDSTFHMLPNLRLLDVSYNDIQYIIHLYDCIPLQILNISHNRVRVLSNISLVIPNIRKLNLSNNQIESLDGLDKLYFLEKLDISYNKITDFNEFNVLVKLEKLTHIYAIGNPISSKNNYRLHVLTYFLLELSLTGKQLPILDGINLSSEEFTTLRSSIFLPPEISPSLQDIENSLHSNSSSNLNSSVFLLVGGILMKSDDVPVHELDKLFEIENKKNKLNNNQSQQISQNQQQNQSNIKLKQIEEYNNNISSSNSNSNSHNSSISRNSNVYINNKIKSNEVSRVKLQQFCKSHGLKRRKHYNIREIDDDNNNDNDNHVENVNVNDNNKRKEKKSLEPVDLTLLMRSSSINSIRDTRHSNETLTFSDAGVHLLEFEDGDIIDNNLHYSPDRNNTRSISSNCNSNQGSDNNIPTRSESLSSSNEFHQNNNSQTPSIRSISTTSSGNNSNNNNNNNNNIRNREAIDTKSIDSGDPSSNSSIYSNTNDSNNGYTLQYSTNTNTNTTTNNNNNNIINTTPNTIISEEVPDLFDLMRQMSEVSLSQQQHLQEDQQESYDYDRSSIRSSTMSQQSFSDPTRILIDVINGENSRSSYNSNNGLFDNSQLTSQDSINNTVNNNSFKSISNQESNENNENIDNSEESVKNTRKSRWGVSKPPLSHDLRGYNNSKNVYQYPSYQTSQRSNSPPGSIISDSWEYKHNKKSNFDSMTETSSVYSSEDLAGFHADIPTINQLKSAYQNAMQEDASLYASFTAKHLNNNLNNNNLNNNLSSLNNKSIGPIQSYTGSIEFEYLSIIDNLEKYFSEQVFGSGRPSGDAPYMRYEFSLSNSNDSNRFGRNFSNLQDFNPMEILYIDIPYQPERFVGVYRVKLLDVTEIYENQNNQTNSRSNNSNNNNNNNNNSNGGEIDLTNIAQSMILVLTDINLYIVLDNFTSHQKFGDAPLPVVRRIHAIESLRSCTVYFGFQRFAFEFVDSDIDISIRHKYQTQMNSNLSETIYMILTGDKSLTYPLITTIPTISNELRNKKSLPKIIRKNCDSEFLEKITNLIKLNPSYQNILETDVIYYQMVSQLYKKKNDVTHTTSYVLISRALVITPKVILLCHENYNQNIQNVNIQLIDSFLITNLLKIRQENDPLKITLIFKSDNSLISSFMKKKWKLVCDKNNITLKIRDELRKLCFENNINDI